MDANFRNVTSNGEKIGWISYQISKTELTELVNWMKHNSDVSHQWERQLLNSVYNASWPINIIKLAEGFPNLSGPEIQSFLEKRYGAEVQDGIVMRVKKISPVRLVIYVLRKERRPMQPSEIAEKCREMFGVDIREHAISGTLGRMSEALIVERGMYNLYENLILNSTQIKVIADATFKYIQEIGTYVSAKVIHKDLFQGIEEYNNCLTDYMILGITQDDERFSVKRGLMIGLNSEGFEDNFVSLYETIYKIVEEHGPCSPSEVKALLHKLTHRDILSVTISIAFRERESSKFVAVGEGTYDLLNRAIGDENDVLRVKQAIEISLSSGSVTGFHLIEKLESVGITMNIYMLLSLCSKFDNIEVNDRLISLTSPSEKISDYNNLFEKLFNSSLPLEENRKNLKMKIGDAHLQSLVALDSRLHDSRVGLNCTDVKDNNDDLLDRLIEEFNF